MTSKTLNFSVGLFLTLFVQPCVCRCPVSPPPPYLSVFLSPEYRLPLCGAHFVIQMQACTHAHAHNLGPQTPVLQAVEQPDISSFGLCDRQRVTQRPGTGSEERVEPCFWPGDNRPVRLILFRLLIAASSL